MLRQKGLQGLLRKPCNEDAEVASVVRAELPLELGTLDDKLPEDKPFAPLEL